MRFAELRIIAAFSSIALACVLPGCGGGSGSKSPPVANNTQPIIVNAGPNGNYANGLFTTVTVCAPGSSNCQALSGVLVDTGSFGLRVLSSALTVPLTQQKDSSGNPVVECAQFSLGITWGPVKTGDVKIAGEQASAIPIQVIGDSAFSSVPSGCSAKGAPQQDLKRLGANGILGVGSFIQDCGLACAPGTSNNPGFYYGCAGSSCQVIALNTTQQVQNPVAFFSADNNGVIIDLPAVSTSAPSVSGSLIFGIGTQNNNSLNSAQVLTLDPSTGNFSTTFKGTNYKNAGFIDSGSNAYFFLDSTTTGIPDCSSSLPGFYCPSSPVNLTAANIGANSTSTVVNFTIDNASTLFSNTTDNVFPTLGGPNPGAFDWGLPFFFGRKVYTAIEGANTPGGLGPYFAY
jgi:hypothetical protein